MDEFKLPLVSSLKKTEPPRKKSKPVVRVKNMPKEFIYHILSLGFNESDAAVLYENKEDWMGLSTGWLPVSIKFYFVLLFDLNLINNIK